MGSLKLPILALHDLWTAQCHDSDPAPSTRAPCERQGYYCLNVKGQRSVECLFFLLFQKPLLPSAFEVQA